MLALSALHLAKFKPDEREYFTTQAVLFHQRALREVAQILPNVTPDNCAATYIFAILTCVIATAKMRDGVNTMMSDRSGLSEWMFSFRGVRSILASAQSMEVTGPIAAIFFAGIKKIQKRDETPVSRHLYLVELYQFLEDQAPRDPEVAPIYVTAVDELNKSYTAIFDPSRRSFEPAEVFFWLFQISDEFITLLAEKRTVPIIIFSYFLVLAKRMELNWWMEGWTSAVMSAIYSFVGHEYQAFLQWPIEQTGWVP
ncbi:hypothetical protein BP5796_01644 [Coleophoma crateriformis]|uniref:Uncharacterized protein n=1 Tax=Coleophoma crateriformis TaxID=565419 RepID=A0A3D8T145_9HELO|nr:hypothetical protein BP5796_01644 [Coleophoma crateriformis]